MPEGWVLQNPRGKKIKLGDAEAGSTIHEMPLTIVFWMKVATWFWISP